MKLIGISGKKRSGKNTIAEYLQRVYGYKEAAFAAPLKESARIIFGLTPAHTDGELKEVLLPAWGLTSRQIMQLLGTEAMRAAFGADVWIKSLFARIDNDAKAVAVSDVRFPNEAWAISTAGGVVVRVNRAGLVSDDHPSETALDDYAFDYVVQNDGSIGELYNQVDAIIEAQRMREVAP